MNRGPVIPGRGLLPASPESITTGHGHWRFTSIYWQAASTERCTSALRTISFAVFTNTSRRRFRALHRAMAWTGLFGMRSAMILKTRLREYKDIKKWRRDWKIRLIEETNPDWIDLFDGIAQ